MNEINYDINLFNQLQNVYINITFNNNYQLIVLFKDAYNKSKYLQKYFNNNKDYLLTTIRVNNQISILISIDSSIITTFTIYYLQLYFNEHTYLNNFNFNFEKLLELINCLSFFEIDDYIEYIRNIFCNIIDSSSSIEEAKDKLKIKSNFKLPINNELENSYVQLINNIWNNKKIIKHNIQLNSSIIYPNVELSKSNIFIKDTKQHIDLEIPHQILERRNEIKNNKDDTICYICKQPFNFIYRSHTCRSCGAKIHWSCSNSIVLRFKPLIQENNSLITLCMKESLICKKCKDTKKRCPDNCDNPNFKEVKEKQQIIKKFKFYCIKGCGEEIKFDDIKKHYSFVCLSTQKKIKALIKYFWIR